MDKLKDHIALRAAIVGKGLNQGKVAKHINISERSLTSKINGHTDFTETEINKILILLEKTYEELFLPS